MTNLLNQTMDQEEDAMLNKFLTFRIGREIFGIEIRYVMEIIGIQSITAIPETPDYVKGVINLRGQIISVIDARLRLNKPSAQYNDRTCIIVTDFAGGSIGLIVDSVSEVMRISEEDMAETPHINAGGRHQYIRSIGKKDEQVALLIDCDKFFSDVENEQNSEVKYQ